MDCRQNQSVLTTTQKTAFVNAVLELKKRPSVMHPGAQSRYDDFVEIHLNAMMQAMMVLAGVRRFCKSFTLGR